MATINSYVSDPRDLDLQQLLAFAEGANKADGIALVKLNEVHYVVAFTFEAEDDPYGGEDEVQRAFVATIEKENQRLTYTQCSWLKRDGEPDFPTFRVHGKADDDEFTWKVSVELSGPGMQISRDSGPIINFCGLDKAKLRSFILHSNAAAKAMYHAEAR